MERYTLADMGVFIGVLGGVITSLILTLQKSRCKKIKLCGCECDREIKKETEPEPEPEP